MSPAGDHLVRVMLGSSQATTPCRLAASYATNPASTDVDRADRLRDPRRAASGSARAIQGRRPVRSAADPRSLPRRIGLLRCPGGPTGRAGPHTVDPFGTNAKGAGHHRRPQPSWCQGFVLHRDRHHCRHAACSFSPGGRPVRTLRAQPVTQYVGRSAVEVVSRSSWSPPHHCR